MLLSFAAHKKGQDLEKAEKRAAGLGVFGSELGAGEAPELYVYGQFLVPD